MTFDRGAISACVFVSCGFASFASERGNAIENEAYKVTIDSKSNEMTVRMSDTQAIEFVWIPPGEFMMGSSDNEAGRCVDEIRHKVCLTRGFWIGKYEVTQEQVILVCGKYFLEHQVCGTNLPVEIRVGDDAARFLASLNGSASRKTDSRNVQFRLPTEAEWEYACRAGSKGSFFCDSNHLQKYAWFVDNTPVKTNGWCEVQPVGQKHPNAWGLYDMLGNIHELCSDLYAPYTTDTVANPKGGAKDKSVFMVVRGGNVLSARDEIRCAARGWLDPACGESGLRLVAEESAPVTNVVGKMKD